MLSDTDCADMKQIEETTFIKQERVYEAENVQNVPDQTAKVIHEQGNKSDTVSTEARFDDGGRIGDVNMYPYIKHNTTSSMTIVFPYEDSSMYCDECKLKYEGDCPEHRPIIYVDNAEDKQSQNCTKEFSTRPQVVGNIRTKMSGSVIIVPPAASGKGEEISCHIQNHLPFLKQEYIQSSDELVYCDKYLEVGKHTQLSNLLPEYENNKINEMVNKSISTSVVEMTRDSQTESRMNETIASLYSVDYHERTVDICDRQTDCKLTLQNEDCTQEPNNMFSLCKKNEDLSVSDVGYRLQGNLLQQDNKWLHAGEKPYTCDVCDVGFCQSSLLKIHKRMHSGVKPYKCDVCGAGFARYGLLEMHKRTHTGERPYKCDVCNVGFAQFCHLERHKRTHTGERPYKCDVCGAGFVQSCHLERHNRIHTGEKPYKCDFCGVGFAQFCHLERHKRTHTGEKPYKCDICGAGFAQSNDVKIHKRTHTGEKPYKCDVCGVGVAWHTNLATHKRTHTGEKPFKCEVCGVGFAQRSALATHKRTHTGEKPYKCDFCGVGFAQLSALAKHKRLHTGEKPYKCDVCGVGYTHSSALATHKRIHA